MNKPFSGMRGDSVSHLTQKISDPKLAATIIAIDVPLASTPMQVVTGDGIKGYKIIWQFTGASPTGNTADIVTKAWFDDDWLAKNASHTLAKIKNAFQVMYAMSRHAKGEEKYVSKCDAFDTIKTASTPAAASMVALGHICLGYNDYSGSTWWHFNRAAAVDLDCWYDKEIHLKLPDADVSYIKAALLNWKQLLAEVKNITHTAVQHNGRTAYISKDDDQKTILTLEKLLYRK
jgi:hypothetical protein